jgi:hypothetical protein
MPAGRRGRSPPGPSARTACTRRRPSARLRLRSPLPHNGPQPYPEGPRRSWTLWCSMTLARMPVRACSGVMPWAFPFLYFVLRGRVLPRSLLLAFQPLDVALNPRVVAFGCKAREGLRANLVLQAFLGPIPKHARLPVAGLLMAMLTVCQIPKLSTGLGV